MRRGYEALIVGKVRVGETAGVGDIGREPPVVDMFDALNTNLVSLACDEFPAAAEVFAANLTGTLREEAWCKIAKGYAYAGDPKGVRRVLAQLSTDYRVPDKLGPLALDLTRNGFVEPALELLNRVKADSDKETDTKRFYCGLVANRLVLESDADAAWQMIERFPQFTDTILWDMLGGFQAMGIGAGVKEVIARMDRRRAVSPGALSDAEYVITTTMELLKAGELEAARARFPKQLAAGWQSNLLYTTLVREECLAGNLEAASRALDRISESAKRVARAYIAVAGSKTMGQSLGPALLKMGTLADPDPKGIVDVDSFVPLDLLRIQLARGDVAGARLSAESLHSARAYAEIAAAEFRRGRIKVARETLEQALVLADAKADSYDAAGDFYTIAFYLHKTGYLPGLREVAARACATVEPKHAALV